MPNDDPCYLSAIDLVAAFAARTLSPVEVTKAVLHRMDGLNARFNAFCLIDHDGALRAAEASEKRWMAGVPAGPIDGVPTSVKDVVLAAGWPTLRGSRAIDPKQDWTEDAPAVARLREQGAVLLGKTTTPEFGWKGVTDSPLTGVTRNPWDETRTPGGSSGGAAAAALCGFGPLHIGTDGGGSVRIPSAFSGIVGIKAHFGRVPAYPPSPFGTLSHLGPMARTVADAALMLTVMSGPDSRDAHALPYDGRDYTRVIEGGVAGLRIAFSADLGYAEVEPEIAEHVARAARGFSELGANVEALDPGFDNPNELFRTIWYAGAAQIVRKMTPAQRAVLDPGLIALAERGEAITMAAFMDAAAARDRLTAGMRAFHENYDLLLTPTMPTAAFPLGPESPIGENGREWDRWSPFTYPFNLTGQPAATVPCGYTKAGLPAGLQIVGRAYDESMVLRAARAFENAHPEHFRLPNFSE